MAPLSRTAARADRAAPPAVAGLAPDRTGRTAQHRRQRSRSGRRSARSGSTGSRQNSHRSDAASWCRCPAAVCRAAPSYEVGDWQGCRSRCRCRQCSGRGRWSSGGPMRRLWSDGGRVAGRCWLSPDRGVPAAARRDTKAARSVGPTADHRATTTAASVLGTVSENRGQILASTMQRPNCSVTRHYRAHCPHQHSNNAPPFIILSVWIAAPSPIPSPDIAFLSAAPQRSQHHSVDTTADRLGSDTNCPVPTTAAQTFTHTGAVPRTSMMQADNCLLGSAASVFTCVPILGVGSLSRQAGVRGINHDWYIVLCGRQTMGFSGG